MPELEERVSRFLRRKTARAKLCGHLYLDGAMKRSILLTGTGLLLAACASGADVADDADASPDSAVVETLEGIPPQAPAQPENPKP